MKRRNTCAGIFRNRNGRVPVIGKVLRGRNARRLLYYLYGPGLANEHADPHLVAGFSDPAELEPERRPGRNAGLPAARRIAGAATGRRCAAADTTSRSGTARSAPRRRTGCCRMRNGPWSRPG